MDNKRKNVNDTQGKLTEMKFLSKFIKKNIHFSANLMNAVKRLRAAKKEAQKIDPNSLIAMPDHIIDHIFKSLDLADQKSLTESCTKFNVLFSKPRHLKTVWLNLKSKQDNVPPTTESLTRPYINLVRNKKLPVEVIDHLSPSMKRMQVKFSNIFPRVLEKHFVNFLSHFSNLTHLEVSHSSSTFKPLILKPPRVNCNRFELKHLETLIIDSNFFAFLFDHHVDFTTEKLHTIKLFDYSSFDYEHRNPNHDGQTFNDKVRAFIAKQKFLRDLSLDFSISVFDQPIIIHSKLYKLDLTDSMRFSFGSSKEQLLNLIDFIVGQVELSLVKVEIDESLLTSSDRMKLREWRQDLLNLRVDTMEIKYTSSPTPSDSFTSIDKMMLQGRPNLTVKRLKLYIREGETDDMEMFFSLVASKFPSLRRIELSGYEFSPQWDLPQLNGLTNLKEFITRNGYPSASSIMIPTLRCFGFKFPGLSDERSHDLEVKRLITRHGEIEQLVISTNFAWVRDEVIEKFVEIIVFALMNLSRLKLITVDECGPWICIDSIVDRLSYFITQCAQPGFHIHFKQGLEILKRDDSKVVRKCDGRWMKC